MNSVEIQFDNARLFSSVSRQPSHTRRLASSGRCNEHLGVTQENEVQVLDTVDGSCCRGKRCVPSEACTFCLHTQTGKQEMDSHEVFNSALDWFVKRHWPDPNVDRKVVLQFILNIALTKPTVVSGWIDSFCKYRVAEGLNASDLFTARLLECKEYKPRKKTKKNKK